MCGIFIHYLDYNKNRDVLWNKADIYIYVYNIIIIFFNTLNHITPRRTFKVSQRGIQNSPIEQANTDRCEIALKCPRENLWIKTLPIKSIWKTPMAPFRSTSQHDNINFQIVSGNSEDAKIIQCYYFIDLGYFLKLEFNYVTRTWVMHC